MTDKDKDNVRKLREMGYGYKRIANTTGISINTIKSFCRRNEDLRTQAIIKAKEGIFCKHCGKRLIQSTGHRPKKFCGDPCRRQYWNDHHELLKKITYTTLVCKCCGKDFQIYGGRRQKYCSHGCYIKDRFGGRHEQG